MCVLTCVYNFVSISLCVFLIESSTTSSSQPASPLSSLTSAPSMLTLTSELLSASPMLTLNSDRISGSQMFKLTSSSGPPSGGQLSTLATSSNEISSSQLTMVISSNQSSASQPTALISSNQISASQPTALISSNQISTSQSTILTSSNQTSASQSGTSSVTTSSSSSSLTPQKQRTHRCPRCRLCLDSALQLRVHWIVHTGQPPFPCPWCGRIFSTAHGLNGHMTVVHGIPVPGWKQRYMCDDCGKRFANESTLRTHDCVYTGKNLFHCPLCEQRFPYERAMTTHLRTHKFDDPGHLAVSAPPTPPPPPPRVRPPSAYFKSRREAEEKSGGFQYARRRGGTKDTGESVSRVTTEEGAKEPHTGESVPIEHMESIPIEHMEISLTEEAIYLGESVELGCTEEVVHTTI